MTRIPDRWTRYAVLLVLTSAGLHGGCGPRVPPDVVATWDGGSISRAEAERYVRFLEARGLRTGARIDARSGITEILSELAYLKMTAAEAGDADLARPVLFLGPRGLVLVRYYVERKGKRSHHVSDEEAMAFYRENLEKRFTVPESCTFRHVFLRADRRSKEELSRLERTVLERLAAGTPFKQLVAEYSESETARRDGTVGLVRRGRMDPAFEDQLYRMQPKTPVVIRMPQGTHVVEVLEKRPQSVLPFEEVKAQIASEIAGRRDDVERRELDAALRSRYGVLDRTDDPSAGPDDVVLRVRDRELTRRQLEAYLERRTAGTWSQGRDPRLRRSWVDDIILSNLLYLEAVDGGLDKEPAFLDRWEVRRLTLQSRAVVERRFQAAAAAVSDEDVVRAFRQSPGRYAAPGRSQAHFIFVPFGVAPPFELERRLERLEKLALDPSVPLEELGRSCQKAGAILVDMGWATPDEAARIAPEFQRRFIAQKEPGSTGVFKQDEGLFVLVVRAVEPARPLAEPEDHKEIRAQYAALRKKELLDEMKAGELKRRRFEIHSTDIFPSRNAKG